MLSTTVGIMSRSAAPTSTEIQPDTKANHALNNQLESLQHDSIEDHDYPEGGATAWSVVFGAFAAMLSSMGLLNTVGVLQAWVSENQLHGYSESQIGWIFSTYAFFLYIGGAQVGQSGRFRSNCEGSANMHTLGPIFDAHDIRYLIIPGSIGIVAAIMCTSVSTGRRLGTCALESLRTDRSCRVLPIFAIFWRSWWILRLPSIHTCSVGCWPLVLQASGPCYWYSLHGRRARWCNFPALDPLSGPNHWLPLDHANSWVRLPFHVHYCLPPTQKALAA